MILREATEADLPGLLAIYNEVIRTSSAVYTDEEATLEDRRAWFVGRTGLGYPVLVAVDGHGRRIGTVVLARGLLPSRVMKILMELLDAVDPPRKLHLVPGDTPDPF